MLRAFRMRAEVHRADPVAGAYTSHRDWENARVIWSGWASVQPDRAFEVRSPARETSQIRQVIYLPPDVDITAVDRLLIRGEMYEVEGEPMPWRFGALSHTRVKAWKVRR